MFLIKCHVLLDNNNKKKLHLQLAIEKKYIQNDTKIYDKLKKNIKNKLKSKKIINTCFLKKTDGTDGMFKCI